MAIDPSARYPGQIDTTDPTGYPRGKAQNIVVPGDGVGTPWEKDLLNDILGLEQEILAQAQPSAAVPSGVPDKVGASQYYAALASRFDQIETQNALNVNDIVSTQNQNFTGASFTQLTAPPALTLAGCTAGDLVIAYLSYDYNAPLAGGGTDRFPGYFTYSENGGADTEVPGSRNNNSAVVPLKHSSLFAARFIAATGDVIIKSWFRNTTVDVEINGAATLFAMCFKIV